MFIATALLPITLISLQLQKSVCSYKPSDREVNAIACITNVVGAALLQLDVSDKTKVDALKAAIGKAADTGEASAVFSSVFKSKNSQNAHIRIECHKGQSFFDVHLNAGATSTLTWFPSNKVDQCATTTAQGLANIAFAAKILEPQCDKEVVGPAAFLTSLWPATAIVYPYLPAVGYGELNADTMGTQLALCYDDFTKSLNAKIGKCHKVVASCETPVNAVTMARLSISCEVSGKSTEVSSLMLNACDIPGASQQGHNKHIVLEMFDRICDNEGISKAVASEAEPKQIQKLFSEPSTANALVAEDHVDRSMEPSPTLAKSVEEYFKKQECNCEGFRVTDCDKDWPSGPLLRCENDKCTLDLAKVTDMNGQHPATGKAGVESAGSKPRRARLIWTAKKILCGASQNGKTFKTEKGRIAAKVSLMKSEFESALAKAAKNAKL